MFAIGLGFLALFSVISIVLGNEDPRHDTDPRDSSLCGRASAPAELGSIAYPTRPRTRFRGLLSILRAPAVDSPLPARPRRATAREAARPGRCASRQVTPRGPTSASWRGPGRQLEAIAGDELDGLAAIRQPERDRAALRRRSPCRSRARGRRSDRPARSTTATGRGPRPRSAAPATSVGHRLSPPTETPMSVPTTKVTIAAAAPIADLAERRRTGRPGRSAG